MQINEVVKTPYITYSMLCLLWVARPHLLQGNLGAHLGSGGTRHRGQDPHEILILIKSLRV